LKSKYSERLGTASLPEKKNETATFRHLVKDFVIMTALYAT
jgi:hypothetical protein